MSLLLPGGLRVSPGVTDTAGELSPDQLTGPGEELSAEVVELAGGALGMLLRVTPEANLALRGVVVDTTLSELLLAMTEHAAEWAMEGGQASTLKGIDYLIYTTEYSS